MANEEAERSRLQLELERLNARMGELSESLGKKAAARAEYERTIQETESAFVKILESSQMLLSMVKREAACLEQNLCNDSIDCDDSSIHEASGKQHLHAEHTKKKRSVGAVHLTTLEV
ncbi:hypothetical protein QAD02_015255 [Eretmocerus hayati]|uniref:Uncharacterized protein n=1 Tax=Eretmocerus hayati TaxID=131215 RepID=A0ACC2P8P9_9HYME|nr:hypothetical protein QAD02_015255 [Eretmocerus hayati]